MQGGGGGGFEALTEQNEASEISIAIKTKFQPRNS